MFVLGDYHIFIKLCTKKKSADEGGVPTCYRQRKNPEDRDKTPYSPDYMDPLGVISVALCNLPSWVGVALFLFRCFLPLFPYVHRSPGYFEHVAYIRKEEGL